MEQNIARDEKLTNVVSPLQDAPAQAATKKVFMKTYGCQMNVYDSQRMTDALASDGCGLTENMEGRTLFCSIPAISGRRLRRRSIRSSAVSANSRKRRRRSDRSC